MIRRLGTIGVLFVAGAAVVAVVRHQRRAAAGHEVPGGILMGDPVGYDSMSRVLLSSLYQGIAADIAATAPRGARVLEVGCGPGHLSIRLAREHGLDVTGLDLDPAMIERARANGDRIGPDDIGRRPSFLAGDVASLPFPDGSFELVVSTFSMHHWTHPPAGLAEIGRVLRPGGRALVWDLRPGLPLHPLLPDPVEQVQDTPLHLVSAEPWRWPWRLSLAQRMELVAAER